jgi:hypothetical protein
VRWAHRGEVDWRYPLASRIPDPPAYESLIRFLEAASGAGIFTPWLRQDIETGTRGDATDSAWASLPADEQARRIRTASHHGRVHVYAYGSCVTGQPRPDSDLDLLIVHDPPRESVPEFPYAREIDAVVGPLNLDSPRRLDVRVFRAEDFFQGSTQMHARVRQSILAEGITVFSTAREPRYLEAQRAELGGEVTTWTSMES